jgi:hypothetical protein
MYVAVADETSNYVDQSWHNSREIKPRTENCINPQLTVELNCSR